MERIQINGKTIISGFPRKHGDMRSISGVSIDNSKVIFVSGQNMSTGLYRKLIEAVVYYNGLGHMFKLYLDIPMIVRESLKRWMRKNEISDVVVFSETDEVGGKIPEEELLVDYFMADVGFGNCFVVPAQSRVISGTITDLLYYLQDRYGE